MAKRVGVVLSGCGVYDGAEIHESVCTLLALDREGAEIICMAPDKDQAHVVNHQKGEPDEGARRSVLEESARIARGPVLPLAGVSADQIDALVLPGGFGAAKNLCSYAFQGEACDVDPDLKRLLLDCADAGKPIGAACIAPAAVAKAFEGSGRSLTLTIGNDPDTAAALEKWGASHRNAGPEETVVDEANKVVSTPAYMVAQRIGEVDKGISMMVREVLKLC
jgi:enhancing lycopene biosynthesis protein 2